MKSFLFISSILFCAILGVFLIFIKLTSPSWGCSLINKDLFTAAAAIFTVATLLFMAYTYQRDKIRKNSEFYLKQIQNNLFEIRALITPENNNNIKWHQAIKLLKTSIILSKELNESAHKIIYLTDAIDLSYRIADVLLQIPDFRFFMVLILMKECQITIFLRKLFLKIKRLVKEYRHTSFYICPCF